MKSNVTYVKPPLLLTFLFFILVSSNQLNAQRQNLIMENTFEGTNPFSGFQYGNQFCCSYSVTQSSTVARAGTSSVKFDLRASDPIVSSSVRAEIEPQTNDQQEMERWYGLSYYLSNYGADDGAESILQWHDVDGSCPPLSIQVQGGRLRIQQCIEGTNTPNDMGPVVSNTWFDIVMHVKWTTGNTGIIQVWKDGVLMVNKSGIRTNSQGGSYMKVGINKWTWAPPLVGSSSQTERIFYIDEFRMGNENATYADVAPTSAPPTNGNQTPTANAGNNVTITLPTNSTSLTGTGTDPDGTIASYAWTKVSGPGTYTIGSPSSANTAITNLIQGAYTFRLTVTDNGGATAYDDVNVTVNPAPNQPPTANAGNDITLTLPTNSTTLTGSGTDPDGTISSYAWTRVSGPTTYTMGTPNAATTTLTGLVQGTYVFKLTVKDNSNATASDNITVTVNAAPNQPPVARAGNDATITLPVALVTLDGSASSDPDGTITNYSWSRVSGPTTFTLSTPLAAITIVNGLVQGTYVFRLTVTDNGGATSTDDVTVTVNPVVPPNQPPVANAGNDVTLTLPVNSTTLTGSATDPDGTISSYAWDMISGPSTYTIASPNSASTALSNLVQGTYVFSLTATDNSGATDIDYVRVTVNAAATSPNQSPAANAGNDVTLTLPANSTTLNGSGIDPDGTISSYAWSKISGPSAYTLGTPNAASTTLTGLVQGVYVFRLTVTDNGGATASAFVTITVNAAPPPPNQPPTANAGNDITLTLPTNSTPLNGSGTDPDGTIAGYVWAKISGPANYTIGNANAGVTTLSNLIQGVYVFSLTVTDNAGASAIDYITITVNAAPPPPNQPPVANAGNNITLTLPTNSTTLTGSGTDADGSITSYAWSRISGPTTYAFGNASAATTTLTSLVQGVYVCRLTVTDNNGATAYDDVTITVNAAPNQAPTANAGNDISLTLPTNSTTLSGSGTDPDGTISSYAWTRISGPTTYTIGTSNAATTALTGLVQGVYVFRLTVTDNSGATAYDDITVTVNAAPAVNQPPVAHAGNDIVMTLPTNSTSLIGATSVDPDGSIVSYKWTRVSGPTTYVFANDAAVSTNVLNLVQGVYVFRLTVTDNDGATAYDDVTVTVNAGVAPPPPTNEPPVANAGSDITLVMPDNSTTLSGVRSTDPDGVITGYAWQEISGPSQLNLSSRTSSSLPISNLMIGDYVFQLKVTDNNNATSTATVKVTVRNKNDEDLYCNIYPNPTSSNLNIVYTGNNTGKVQIYIYSSDKQYMFGETVPKDQVSLTQSIDVSSYKPGTYFLQIILSGNKKITKKFVKLN